MLTLNRNILALAISALLLSSCASAQSPTPPDSFPAYATFGVHVNQNLPYGLLGITIRTGHNLYAFSGSDLGGHNRAFYSLLAYRFFHSNKISLFAMIGPNVEIVTPENTDPDPISYLTAATSISLAYQINPDIRIILAIQYLATDGDIIKWKYAVALAMPLRI